VLTLCQALRWLIVYAVLNPIALCALVVTKLLVLDRLMEFSKLKARGSSSRWVLFGRVLLAVVVVGSAVGLVGNIVAAVYVAQAADSYASLGARNNTGSEEVQSRRRYYNEARSQVSQAARAASIHLLFEFIAMLLVVTSFVCAGTASIRRIRSAISHSENSQAAAMAPRLSMRQSPAAAAAAPIPDVAIRGQKLQRQILGTCSVVFVAFLVRAVYASMVLIAGVAQNLDGDCGQEDETMCQCNTYANMLVWLLYTPQFYFALALVSQPIALLVALWGMTTGQTLMTMRQRNIEPLQ
jgi:hypothetical protein